MRYVAARIRPPGARAKGAPLVPHNLPVDRFMNTLTYFSTATHHWTPILAAATDKHCFFIRTTKPKILFFWQEFPRKAVRRRDGPPGRLYKFAGL